ncbi:hypothetical protein evm_010119 [Chilo suppressalis]|nr:hypothetical protein evm_010119 [Chilo suppressalis]
MAIAFEILATVSIKHTARTEAPLSTTQKPTKYGSARGDEFASRRDVPQVEAASPLAQPRSEAAARPEAASSGYAAIDQHSRRGRQTSSKWHPTYVLLSSTRRAFTYKLKSLGEVSPPCLSPHYSLYGSEYALDQRATLTWFSYQNLNRLTRSVSIQVLFNLCHRMSTRPELAAFIQENAVLETVFDDTRKVCHRCWRRAENTTGPQAEMPPQQNDVLHVPDYKKAPNTAALCLSRL